MLHKEVNLQITLHYARIKRYNAVEINSILALGGTSKNFM